MNRRLLIILAHPDDETLGAGGTIAKYAAQGVEVHLATATNGEASKLMRSYGSSHDINKIRKRELTNAGKILGINQIYHLNYPDGLVNTVPYSRMKEEINSLFTAIQPQVVITFDTYGISGHPDHQTISRVVTDVFLNSYRAEYNHFEGRFPHKLYHLTIPEDWLSPISWLFNSRLRRKYKGTSRNAITTEIDVSDFAHVKKKACQCFTSQLDNFKRIEKYIGHNLFLQENFILINSKENKLIVRQKEKDLFSNLVND